MQKVLGSENVAHLGKLIDAYLSEFREVNFGQECDNLRIMGEPGSHNFCMTQLKADIDFHREGIRRQVY